MKIQCRKCPFTGEIFEEKNIKEYIKHLRFIRQEMREEREEVRLKNKFKDWISEEKLKITNVDMIPNWFLKNQKDIMDFTNALNFSNLDSKNKNRFHSADVVTALGFSNIRFDHKLSNSHVCPDSGITNWCGRDTNKPTGYTGWKGYLRGSFSRHRSMMSYYPLNDSINLVGIKTGSGGGGNDNFGYEFSIFLDDWPGLQEQVREMEEETIVKKLKGV